MKNYILIPILLLSISVFSQNEPEKKKAHEVKINAFNTVIFKNLEFSYEYLINKESSAGVAITLNLNDDIYAEPTYNDTFSLTPFYRRFFSRKYAWGFFMEGFGMYNIQRNYAYDYYYEDVTPGSSIVRSADYDENIHNFALGMSLGAKFVSSKGFAFEFYGGIGRNLFSSNSQDNFEFVPRLGISLGYRF